MLFRIVQPELGIAVSSHTLYTPPRVWVTHPSVTFSRQSCYNREREDLDTPLPYLNK